jgi:hypothetical protein
MDNFFFTIAQDTFCLDRHALQKISQPYLLSFSFWPSPMRFSLRGQSLPSNRIISQPAYQYDTFFPEPFNEWGLREICISNNDKRMLYLTGQIKAQSQRLIPERCRLNALLLTYPGRFLFAKYKSGNNGKTNPLLCSTYQKPNQSPMMTPNEASSIRIPTMIMPSLNTNHLFPKYSHQTRINTSYKILPSKKKLITQQRDYKLYQPILENFQAPFGFCQKATPSTYMPKMKGAASSNLRKGLFVSTSQKAPKKSHKITTPCLVKTFKKNYNIWYNSHWEEMHLNTPLVKMCCFSRGYHFFPQNANNFN